jgi:hypothetical protein
MPGKAAYQPRAKHTFIVKMRELGYLVEQQQESISILMGLSVAQAEEIADMQVRVKKLEARQPSAFVRV